MIERLCEQIWSRPNFHEDFNWLTSTSAKLQFKLTAPSFTENSMLVFRRVLQCALAFSLSRNPVYRQAAYEIAVCMRNITHCSRCIIEENSSFAPAISLIFSRLGNFPAEKKFVEEAHLILNEKLPVALWFDREFHVLNNSISIADGEQIAFTDFQLQLWEAISCHEVVIVNAPTSTGKSFVLQNHIIDSLSKGKNTNVIYIVPTRALIEQVIAELRNICRKLPNATRDSIVVTEVPNTDSMGQRNIFVLTQERTQLLLDCNVGIDLVVIDEAQNVADNARGVILQSVIERLKSVSQTVKFIFATPFVKNPEVFLSMFHLDGSNYIVIPFGEPPVSQNLYSVLITPNNLYDIEISKLNSSGSFSAVCTLQSSLELSDERKYLAIVPLMLGNGQNNIIYANEPSSCEHIASLISQWVAMQNNQPDCELIEFSDYIKDRIHKDYLLGETIKNGVAYHYGNLPAFIRKGIERLCISGKIKYIVCTSTLLQGVNLPAQNIFIMKPAKGHDSNNNPIPMDAPDFWNLAGRAGRLTKDFEGNIFLINVDEWSKNPVLNDERRQIISPSFIKYVCDPTENLCPFIADRQHKSGQSSSQGLENTFMKLFLLNAEGRLEEVLDSLGVRLPQEQRTKIISSILSATKDITLPYDVYSKNPNVSVYRQQELYMYIKKRISEKGAQYLIPPHPMHRFKTISNDYLRLFLKLDKYLSKDTTKRHKYFSMLALLWMRGETYRDLLASRIDYANNHRRRGKANVNTEARGLFDDIEYALRFTYVKFSKCYNDLLAFALDECGEDKYKTSIPPLHLYLELGGSSGTMINLMGMGLSRTAAAQIAPHMISSSMTRDEILTWVKYNNIYALGLPQSVITEFEHVTL